MSSQSADDERARVLELVRRHGRNTTAFQVLEQGFRYEFFGDDACVAYVDTGASWVAAGAPLAHSDRLAEIGDAFIAVARRRGRRVAFFATEARFAERSASTESLLVGEQPVWDPRDWPEIVQRSKSLREQLRRARSKGVRIERLSPATVAPGSPARVAIEALIARWLRTRPMAPMGFLVQVEPFAFAEERRHYVAWQGEALVGFLALIPIYGRAGWFFEDLLREPRAPNGSTELLFDAAMNDLASDGVGYATFGLAPLAGTVERWLEIARAWGRPLYDFSGLRAFKQKLSPERWDPVYLSFPKGTWSAVAIYDALSAFSRQGILRFGASTLLRGPDVVVRLLAAMLVPWTVALASVDTTRWFPAARIQRAWVIFDVMLLVGLFVLLMRWRQALATALAAAITADACVTLIEALTWNALRVRATWDVAVIVTAVAAPTLAAIVMWNARARHALSNARG